MGFGHSETIGRLSLAGRRYLPLDTKYEANWWERAVRLDGLFHGQTYDAAAALEAAKSYANRVSVGSLPILRQFLEASIRKSERPARYLETFPMMLVSRGKDLLLNKLKRLLQVTSLYGWEVADKVKNNLDLVIKTMLGFTRKRELLVPEWAD